MKFSELKKPIILITYAIVLYLVLGNLNMMAYGLKSVFTILSPIFIGIIIAFIINLLMRMYEEKIFKSCFKKRKKLKRPISIALSYITAILIIFLIFLVIIPKISDSIAALVGNIPSYAEKIGIYLTKIADDMGIKDTITEKFNENIGILTDKLSHVANLALSQVINITVSVTSSVVKFLIGIILSVYMLISKEKLILMVKKITYVLFGKKAADKIIKIFSDSNIIFRSFIEGQLIECCILGTLCFIGMSVLKMPYAPLISVIVGVMGLIPILGAYISLFIGAFLILLVNPMTALWFIIFIIVLQQLEGNLIYPKVVGSAIGINGFFVLIAISVSGSMFGIVGMLLGVPIMAVLYSVIGEFVNSKYEKIK